MAVPAPGGVDLSRKFVSETEIEEKRKQRQEEWEKVRKPEDPEEVPEEAYDGRSLFDRLQEQKDKKQEEYEEQFKFKNMVKGLDEDESHFLDEVSRQQSLVEKQRRDEELHELNEYRLMMARRRLSETVGDCRLQGSGEGPKIDTALKKLATTDSRKEPEKRAGPKPAEVKTSHLSQAHLLAGAVKRRSSSQSSDSSKRQKVEEPTAAIAGRTEQEAGGGAAEQGSMVKTTGVLHLPSAAVCVGILPGLGAYSGSSDSESSSDSEGSVDRSIFPIKGYKGCR